MKLTDEQWERISIVRSTRSPREFIFAIHQEDEQVVRAAIDKELKALPDASALMVTLEEAKTVRDSYLRDVIANPSKYGDELMLIAINTVLARRPAAQKFSTNEVLLKRRADAEDRQDISLRHEPYSAPVEQEADGDVVEEVAEAIWGVATTSPLIDAPSDFYDRTMDEARAALTVARAHFAAHPPEGWHKTEQVKTATERAARVCHHLGLGFGEMWEQIRAGLSAPQKPVERVTIQSVPCDIAKSGTRYNVLLDGELQEYFYLDTHAECYAAGLRLELADKGERP